jgi:autotransporter-associated beta strand protein
LAQRNNSTVSVENVSGDNTLAGTISIQSGGNTVILQSDSGLLTLSGTLQSVATSTTPRTVTFSGASSVGGLVSGLIRDNDGVAAVSLAIVKAGTGTWTISGTNTYTGGTAVTAGTLVMTAPQALGGGSVTVNSGTLDIQTSGTDSYTLNMNSTNNGTIVLDLPTAGPAVTRSYANFNIGVNDTMTFVSGVNVTSGVPTLALTGVNLSSGVGGGSSTLNPTTATISIGTVSTSTNSGKTLDLDGTSLGNTITGAITDGSNTVSLAKTGTSAWVLSGNNTYTGTTTVKAGTLELAANSQAPVLTNAGGADVQGGRMILDYSGTSPAANLRTALAAGRVRDSVATAGIGVAYFDDGTSKVVVRPDLFGDANGDNTVNALDFNALASNFGTGQFWQQGDFTYDGVVNTSDFNLLAQYFNQVTPSLEPSLTPALGTLVPEPGSVGLLSVVGLAHSRRRRRK